VSDSITDFAWVLMSIISGYYKKHQVV